MFLNQTPFAILPAKLEELATLYAAHLRGEAADVAAIEARVGRPLNNAPKPAQRVGSVAVVPVEGVLLPHGSLLMQVSGAMSPQQIGAQFQSAIDDPAVSAVVLAINSPGGAVAGIQQLSDTIFAARGSKPIYAVGDGVMASAAYWVGSAADKVFAADDTTLVGSVGVLATHVDQSAADAARGVKVTEVTAGKFKAVTSQHRPLSDAGASVLQQQVDQLYSTFVGQVARNRGVSTDAALGMADGAVFVGPAAQTAGLVDGIATIDAIIAQLSSAQPLAASTPNRTGQTMAIKTNAATSSPLVARALAHIEAQAAQGINVSADDAVAHVMRRDGIGRPTAPVSAAQADRRPEAGGFMAPANVATLDVAAKAREYVRAQAAQGVQVSVGAAVAHVMQRDGLASTAQHPNARVVCEALSVADKARKYIDQQAALGRKVSVAEAVTHVSPNR